MSTSERWTAIGAIGAMLAGISEIVKLMTPLVQSAWELMPEAGFDVWVFIEVLGLLTGGCGALVAIWLAVRRRATAPPAGIEAGRPARNTSLLLALMTLALTTTVGVAFYLTGGFGSFAKTIDSTKNMVVRGGAARDTRADSLDKVCADARKTYHGRSVRPRLPGPPGDWTGWVSWRGGEQQWRLEPDGSVQLTAGYPGKWRFEGSDLIIRFDRKTVFRARIFGELMCGVRLRPDGNLVPDGNFQLVFLKPPEAPAESELSGNDSGLF